MKPVRMIVTPLKSYNPDAIPSFIKGEFVRIVQATKEEYKNDKSKCRVYRGTVIAVSSKHITVLSKRGRKETFRYDEFLTGDIFKLETKAEVKSKDE